MNEGLLSRWLSHRSISQRLALQTRASVILCILLIATLVSGSMLSLSINRKDSQTNSNALSAALLEKDFASLERDVYRHAALMSDESRQDMEGNIADLQKSIGEARSAFGDKQADQVDQIEQTARTYVDTVHKNLAQPSPSASALQQISEAGNVVDDNIEKIREPIIAESAEIAREQEQITLLVMILTVTIAGVVGLTSFLLARGIKNAIGEELQSLTDVVANVSAGQLHVDIPYTERSDDLGELARAAVRLRENSLAKQKADSELREMLDIVESRLAQLSEGDLTVSLPHLGGGYAELQHHFNTTVEKLRAAMSSVTLVAEGIRSSAAEITIASDELAHRTETNASELSHTAGTISSLTTGVRHSAADASRANQAVQAAVGEATSGGQVVRQAVDAMGKIEEATGEIVKIIAVIDDITFQTNLLALNAGVEAARAGELGKGFAVVANEVRALAQRSAEAARDVKALITANAQEVTSGVALVREAGTALEKIVERIGEATGLVEDISTAANEQAQQLEGANSSVARMDAVTQQSAAMAEESTAVAKTLAHEASRLAQMVAHFRVAA